MTVESTPQAGALPVEAPSVNVKPSGGREHWTLRITAVEHWTRPKPGRT